MATSHRTRPSPRRLALTGAFRAAAAARLAVR
jgi:hypothetical protein